MSKDKGLLVVLSSPSGGGKTTVIKRIMEENNENYVYSISMTTRPIRDGEVHGVDYLFVSHDEFMEMIRQNLFIEYERVHDWYYGTPRGPIDKWIDDGVTVFLDLDVLGALRLKRQFEDNVLLIFLKPPSEKVLLQRLHRRSTETPSQIGKRLERVAAEMARAAEFDVVIVNENLQKTIGQVKKAIADKKMALSCMEV
ncbi:guanylate kinase [candidate division KSB1 bacterium]|nr:guanylate kinase [candidate division KSB1 bacterium]